MHKRSLQTISWGDPQHHMFDHIFSVAANAGFEGVEIGFRRLGQISIDKARTLFDKYQLRLSACHVGGNLADLAQASNERDALKTVLNYVCALNSQYLIYSGLNVTSKDELDVEIKRLHDIANDCADREVTLLYHNHDWEFRDNRRIWNYLQDAKINNLGYAPDLGWAVKGGQKMGELLEEIGDAIKLLHFKDFVSWEDGQNTCHLGEGVVDFSPAWKWLPKLNTQSLWLTAEQDNAVNNDEACAVNGAYLANRLIQSEL